MRLIEERGRPDHMMAACMQGKFILRSMVVMVVPGVLDDMLGPYGFKQIC